MSRIVARIIRRVESEHPEGAPPAEVHPNPPEHPAAPVVPDPAETSTEDPIVALQTTVSQLVARVETLAADVEGKINPPPHTDSRPSKPPWTHRNPFGRKS